MALRLPPKLPEAPRSNQPPAICGDAQCSRWKLRKPTCLMLYPAQQGVRFVRNLKSSEKPVLTANFPGEATEVVLARVCGSQQCWCYAWAHCFGFVRSPPEFPRTRQIVCFGALQCVVFVYSANSKCLDSLSADKRYSQASSSEKPRGRG